jgi:hypothetical protein
MLRTIVAVKSLFSSKEAGKLIQWDEQFIKNLCLTEEKPKCDEKIFEFAVLNLISLAGYEVIFTGKGVNTKGIDMLAFRPESSNIIIISCTISNDIGNKIGTILPQINMLKKQLGNYKLIPVIVSPINDNDIRSTHKTDLAEHEIALLLSYDLKKIFDEIQKNSGKEFKDFFQNYILGKIPHKSRRGDMVS